jgi:phosphoenolpyruvate synthase/pyruvate phosphate dikinase
MSSTYVLGFKETYKSMLPLVGGKGANLGELSHIDDILVPEGFCVTTEAYKAVVSGNVEVSALIDELAPLQADDREKIESVCAKIRAVIEKLPIPPEISAPITQMHSALGEQYAYAVRSSATAEDLPTNSFAGQQDTYLNITGADAMLLNIKKCWASLFAGRAASYRIQNGFGHRNVFLSVVVQRMVFPQAAGIMFTADPITQNRKVLTIDASFGLGEALVSGLTNADLYKVRDGRLLEKKIATKTLAIYACENGGTEESSIPPEKQNDQTLTDEQILQLAVIGRNCEARFGCPQDIEWGFYEGSFYVIQSRPITTLYPIPQANDGKNHIYISYGHRQMMTDAFKPLGISFFKLLDKSLGRPEMCVSGGRFWRDMSFELTSAIYKGVTISSFSQVDVLMQRALINVMKRKDFVKGLARGKASVLNFGKGGMLPMLRQLMKLNRVNDPSVVPELIANNDASIRRLKQGLAAKSGDSVFEYIMTDHTELADIMYEPRSVAAAYLGINTANWLNKHIEQWLGEKNSADILGQASPHNVVSDMGLELFDVADVVRGYPVVARFLEHTDGTDFWGELSELQGGDKVAEALRAYLERYGMHCSGDIDITRPRWGENPALLAPMILGNIKNFAPGARGDRVKQARSEAEQKAGDIIARLERLPGGRAKAKKVKRQISVLRNFIGYREYSKHALLQRYWLYKQALLREAEKLTKNGVIREKEDIYYLSFEELREAVQTGKLDYDMIRRHKAEHEVNMKLTPPRVITSDGEVISGDYDTGKCPAGALAGIAVSSGVAEGRARVLLNMQNAALEDGDILVTAFIDPSWSPMLVSAKGVVMEVGGVMTHGAVIAREYGVPCIAGVENATKRIEDGQRIRVNGSEGYVEILE